MNLDLNHSSPQVGELTDTLRQRLIMIARKEIGSQTNSEHNNMRWGEESPEGRASEN
jgi:hypothetical protein